MLKFACLLFVAWVAERTCYRIRPPDITNETVRTRPGPTDVLVGVLTGGIKIDDDSAGRVGDAAAGGFNHRLRDDREAQEAMLASLGKHTNHLRFEGRL